MWQAMSLDKTGWSPPSLQIVLWCESSENPCWSQKRTIYDLLQYW